MTIFNTKQTRKSPVESLSSNDTVTLIKARKDAPARQALKSLKKSPAILSSFTSEEIFNWLRLGRKFLTSSKQGEALSKEYFEASSKFLSIDTQPIFEYWVKSTLQISRYSFDAAIAYIQSTPNYLEHEKPHGLQPWTEEIVGILERGELLHAPAIGFIRLSPLMIKFMHHNQFELWKKTGLALAEQSPDTASNFFSVLPKGLDSLFITEQKTLFKSVIFIAGTNAKAAVQFYNQCPKILMGLNPDIRNKVMKITHDFCHGKPKSFLLIFYELTSNLSPLSYPDQERILTHLDGIRRFSTDGALAFLKNISFLTAQIPGHFFSNWISTGVSIIQGDLQKGIEYFSLKSRKSQWEINKWSSAIHFEDIRGLISLYTTALCGKNLKIQTVDEINPPEKFHLLFNSKKKNTIYFPSYYAKGQKQHENFCYYKVAAAHQAGHIEFETFNSDFDVIWEMLGNLPVGDLARELFFILEDGRINANLKKTYRGLRPDIDEIFLMEIEKKPFPTDNILMIAIECLRRLVTDFFNENVAPREFQKEVSFLRRSLEGFVEKAESNWDSYHKAIDIYHYLRPFTENFSYVSLNPMPPQERIDIPVPGGDDLKKIKGNEEKKGDHLAQDPSDNIEDFNPSTIIKDKIMSQGMPRKLIPSLSSINDTVEMDSEGLWEKNQPYAPSDSNAGDQEGPCFYDEWDYLQGTYRKRWCCLYEKMISPLSGERYDTISQEYEGIIKKVKKQFQRIRPVLLEPVRRVEWGDEIDLDEIIHGIVDRKLGGTPSDKIFQRKEKINKRISILLLMDMSASTDEIVRRERQTTTVIDGSSGQSLPSFNTKIKKNKRIIDILTESLVVIIEALEALGDPYAVYGFSGQGRHQVKFYNIKNFSTSYSDAMKSKIGSIQPKQSTRMGCAIRHAIRKFKSNDSDIRLLILLSDGFPQDMDYGEDRTSKSYALNDTFMAFAEARREGIQPFCITVDQTGNDHLKKIQDPKSYLLIEDIDSLPAALPKIVESLIV